MGHLTRPGTEWGWGGSSSPTEARIPRPPVSLLSLPYPCCFWVTCILSWSETFQGHYQSHVNPKASAQGPHLWLPSHQSGPSKRLVRLAARRVCPRLNLILLLLACLPSSATSSLPYGLHPASHLPLSASSLGWRGLRSWGQGAVRIEVGLGSQESPGSPGDKLGSCPAG